MRDYPATVAEMQVNLVRLTSAGAAREGIPARGEETHDFTQDASREGKLVE
ncbi:hypothetical protein [Paeniglutamicibacter sp. NPDC091659]|uniref:hypothetical protein n=1 Tax=Paeniglutamicibacter sp. NPDC091659 TaxID=3364389 RepID=UPI00382B1B81